MERGELFTAESLRSDIEQALMSRSWFQASTLDVQVRLLNLPGNEDSAQNCNGYLADLANRSEVGGGVVVRRITDVLIPSGRIFGIFTNLEVEKIAIPGKFFGYQYFSWRQGPQSGAKGLVLIKTKQEELTHAIVLNGYSFAAAKNTMDSLGGFAEVDENGVSGMLACFQRELCEELGVSNFRVERVIRLGAYYPDRGMTNNHPELFASIISLPEPVGIQAGDNRNIDQREMHSVPCIVPISSFWGKNGLLQTSEDGYFLACVARLVGLNVLKPAAADQLY